MNADGKGAAGAKAQTSKGRLGRGLDSLLPPRPSSTPPLSSQKTGSPGVPRDKAAEPTRASPSQGQATLPIEHLHPNKQQPRKRFESQAIEELAASIKEYGILEPLLVKKAAKGGYLIVAGERRWRAAQKAGLHEVPVILREFSEKVTFEVALVENLQREDLNPVEVARGLKVLIEEHGHTQESAAKIVGKDRSTVANALRLLKLPDEVLDYVAAGDISEGHGRAILAAPSPSAMCKLARLVKDAGLSVRETERRAKQEVDGKSKKPQKEKSANVRALEERLARQMGAKVSVEDKDGKGYIALHYADYDALDVLLERLGAR